MSKSFESFQEAGNNLMVVDALNLAFRWKHSGATHFREEYIKVVASLARSYKAQQVIIAADQGSSSYRKQIYPAYKQNRKDKFELQTAEEKQEFEEFFHEFTHTLDDLTELYPVLRFPGVEADDIAAYIAGRQRKLKFDHIWLISSDKDYDLLVNDKVSRFSYVTRKETTQDNWHEHYEFGVEDYISIKCLTGDSGDNILGVSGIGPKRAASLVAEYGSCWDIISSLPILGKKYKYIQELNNSKELLELNYKLMDLQTHCSEAIGANTKTIDELLELYQK
jgi:5'-3' exonuclease